MQQKTTKKKRRHVELLVCMHKNISNKEDTAAKELRICLRQKY